MDDGWLGAGRCHDSDRLRNNGRFQVIFRKRIVIDEIALRELQSAGLQYGRKVFISIRARLFQSCFILAFEFYRWESIQIAKNVDQSLNRFRPHADISKASRVFYLQANFSRRSRPVLTAVRGHRIAENQLLDAFG